ncbi:MAG: hypothetical protein OXG58_03325 [Gemmatimonadetes bacterium]|nr:hypothetical protein [Gemmatimonadota bacterium]MCY3942484.1 hypothetical protein [Gemmatimonadota bacterium]
MTYDSPAGVTLDGLRAVVQEGDCGDAEGMLATMIAWGKRLRDVSNLGHSTDCQLQFTLCHA